VAMAIQRNGSLLFLSIVKVCLGLFLASFLVVIVAVAVEATSTISVVIITVLNMTKMSTVSYHHIHRPKEMSNGAHFFVSNSHSDVSEAGVYRSASARERRSCFYFFPPTLVLCFRTRYTGRPRESQACFYNTS